MATHKFTRWTLQDGIWTRIGRSVLGLYFATGVYTVFMEIIDLPYRIPDPNHNLILMSIIAPFGVMLWLTVPLFWPLFPLSYLNHYLLALHESKAGQSPETKN